MSDILEQINSLTEQFSNLFEVEGLGDPASDTPPSTNKIKKDRKTKDGKVELVSVEDELFPYDGNKREQYRQKIIDTINNMIQGTATLEDLLQLVRSKQVKPVKEGFEGAIEILENIHQAIEKYVSDPKKKKELHDKAFDNYVQDDVDQMDRIENKLKGVKKNSLEAYNKAFDIKRSHDTNKNIKGAAKTDARSGIMRSNPDVDIDQDEFRDQEKEYRRKKFNKSEGFEGAIEILENIWSQITKVHGDTKKTDKLHAKADANEFNEFKQAAKRENKSEDALDVKRNETKNKSLEQSYRDTIGRRYEAGDKEINQEFYDDEARRATLKSIKRHGNKPIKEGFEGAIEILEEIINEVSSTTMRNALHAHNERKRELEDRANKRIGEIFKKNGIKGNTYGATTPEDRERAIRTEKEIQNDSEMKNIQKEQEKRSRKNKLYVDALNKIHRAKLVEA